MIRTGYLRWEIEVQDIRSRDDRAAREVIFLARPSYRIVRVKTATHGDAAERFARGEATYDSVLRTTRRHGSCVGASVSVSLRLPRLGMSVRRVPVSGSLGRLKRKPLTTK